MPEFRLHCCFPYSAARRQGGIACGIQLSWIAESIAEYSTPQIGKQEQQKILKAAAEAQEAQQAQGAVQASAQEAEQKLNEALEAKAAAREALKRLPRVWREAHSQFQADKKLEWAMRSREAVERLQAVQGAAGLSVMDVVQLHELGVAGQLAFLGVENLGQLQEVRSLQ